jgi:hypothetical protein
MCGSTSYLKNLSSREMFHELKGIPEFIFLNSFDLNGGEKRLVVTDKKDAPKCSEQMERLSISPSL